MRRALVVAHPDDESLWFGGLLIAEPGDWTVIACSIPSADPIRAWKFFDACDILGARARLLPFEETALRLEHLDLSGFDQVVTHSAAGEYGHAHHQMVHRHVALRCAGRALVGLYGMPGAQTQDKVIALADEQWARKAAAIAAYDHVSPTDGRPKGEALIARYGRQFNLRVERYARA